MWIIPNEYDQTSERIIQCSGFKRVGRDLKVGYGGVAVGRKQQLQ